VRTEVVNGAETWEENSGAAGFGGFRGGFGGRAGARRGDDQAAAPGDRPGRGPGFDPAQMKAFQLRARQADLARLMVMWLLDTDAPVTWVGTAESPDGKADVLELRAADASTRLFLDQATHMPLMITWQVGRLLAAGRRGGGGDGQSPPVSRAPEQPALQFTMSDYRVVNGLKLPHLITRGTPDRTIEEWNVKSYKLNPVFKADVFTK
jgi:hypothetical protein